MAAPDAPAACLLHFGDERAAAARLAAACGLPALEIARHRFPDGELKLTLPVDAAGQLPARAVLLRSLDQPNDKLIELLLAARAARAAWACGSSSWWRPTWPICARTSPSTPARP